MYHNGKGTTQDYKQAFLLFKEAADLGYPKAKFEVAKMHLKGEGTPKNLGKVFSFILELHLMGVRAYLVKHIEQIKRVTKSIQDKCRVTFNKSN